MRALFLWLATCLTLSADGHRIASYSPGATQTLIDLGCSPEIVMATRWCPLPKEHLAARDADVFLPDLERLLKTKPDLVILPRMANPLWAEKCAKAGLRTLVLNPESRDSVSKDILLIGEATGRTDAAKKIAAIFANRPATTDAKNHRHLGWSYGRPGKLSCRTLGRSRVAIRPGARRLGEVRLGAPGHRKAGRRALGPKFRSGQPHHDQP